MFICQGGSISCQVTGNRRCSADLLQKELKLPCHLKFTCPSKGVGKLQKLLDKAPKLAQATNLSVKEPLNLKAKLDETCLQSVLNSTAIDDDLVDVVWMMSVSHTSFSG
uniref:Uncharacterized protein n=1 Tax=Amphimedon queenslandica TaxID=400682 RepID=A0A1X7UND4_AMPQE